MNTERKNEIGTRRASSQVELPSKQMDLPRSCVLTAPRFRNIGPLELAKFFSAITSPNCKCGIVSEWEKIHMTLFGRFQSRKQCWLLYKVAASYTYKYLPNGYCFIWISFGSSGRKGKKQYVIQTKFRNPIGELHVLVH